MRILGDTFGLCVTHFGACQSTVLFVLNGEPVATRYLFETDLSRFLPTVAFEDGATVGLCELEITFGGGHQGDHMIRSIVFNEEEGGDYESGHIRWIRPAAEDACHMVERSSFSEFENVQNGEDMPLQSPLALSRHICHYKCTQIDFNGDGSASTNVNKREGASVGLASCSPLKPTPTSSLLRDYYTWLPHLKCISLIEQRALS
jgi:hypothetical protein